MSPAADQFFEPYDRDQIAYGDQPSPVLLAYLEQIGGGGTALDLGAGAGRDTIALARAGYHVTAVDLSQRGLERIEQRARLAGVSDRVETSRCDVRELAVAADGYDAVVATTVLDHIPYQDAIDVWHRIAASITPRGFLYTQVHTTEDPGSDRPPGSESTAPVSETANAVINYFAPNQLAAWAIDPQHRLRVLRYEERLEWDYTHGPEHLHGKAVLLAVRQGYHPDWLGQPPVFPRQEPDSPR